MGRHGIRHGDAGSERFAEGGRETLQVAWETRSAWWSIRHDDDRGFAGRGSHLCWRGGDYVAAVRYGPGSGSCKTALRGRRTSTACGDPCRPLSAREFEAL